MAEEHRCQAPEGHRLCANNCGFFGSPATMDLCSQCYRDFRLKEQQQASTQSTIETALSSAAPPPSVSSPSPAVESLPPPSPDFTLNAAENSGSEIAVAALPNRCGSCRKRVGLTGFKCRCGVTFCGVHRYPERHGCGFDFKKVGRDEIAKANPLIKAEKLQRI